MKLIRHIQSHPTPVAATIGNFDGIHLGHQKLIGDLCKKAEELGLPSMLITFEPTPQEYFLKDNAPARITRMREKLALLKNTAIDYVVILRFDKTMADMSAEDFINLVLRRDLNVHYLLVGDDFHFGKNRLGDFALLESFANSDNFVVENMQTQRLHDERISSSRIRIALQEGDLATVERLLGRPYSMLGRVTHGNKRGRTIDFPTANIFLKRHRSPVLGVYAVKVYGVGTEVLYGVANVGNRPTVDGTRSLLEVYLFDFNKDIYGVALQVEFCHKIRDEKRYDSFELLKQQIKQDVKAARYYFQS